MAAQSSPNVATTSMRIACERCRAQKVRCIANKDGESRCNGCVDAAADCYHSPQRRPGRPSTRTTRGVKGSMTTQRPSDKQQKPAQPMRHQQQQLQPSLPILVPSTPFTENLAGSVPMFPYSDNYILPDQAADDLSNNQEFSLSSLPPSPSPIPDLRATDALDSLFRYEGHSPTAGSQLDEGNQSQLPRIACAETSTSPVPPRSTSLGLTPAPEQGPPTPLLECSDIDQLGNKEPDSLHNVQDLNTDLYQKSPLQDDKLPSLQLSELMAQLMADKETSSDGLSHQAAHVLRSTTSFIDILERYAEPADEQCHHEVMEYNRPSTNSLPITPPSSTSCLHTTPWSSRFSTPYLMRSQNDCCYHERQRQRMPLSSSVDTSSTLLLLSCHLRLLSLHAALYSTLRFHLQNNLMNMPKTSPLPLFPDMHIASFALSGFPNFQYKMLIQLCLDLLSKVEALLDLPDLFAVSSTFSLGKPIDECEHCYHPRQSQTECPSRVCGEKRKRGYADCEGREGPISRRLEGCLHSKHESALGCSGLVRVVMEQGDNGGGSATIREIVAVVTELRHILKVSIEV